MSFRSRLAVAASAAMLIGAPAMAAEPIVSTYTFTSTFDTFQLFGPSGPLAGDLGVPGPLSVTGVFSFEADELSGGFGDVHTTVQLNGGLEFAGGGYASAANGRSPTFRVIVLADVAPSAPGLEALDLSWTLDTPSAAFEPFRALVMTDEVLQSYPIIARLEVFSYPAVAPVARVIARQSDPTTSATMEGEPLVLAVPEPSTWALMIFGFGTAGAALRRRRAPYTALAK